MKEDRQMVKMKRSKKHQDEHWEVEEEERVRTRFLGEQKVYFPSLNPWDRIFNPWDRISNPWDRHPGFCGKM